MEKTRINYNKILWILIIIFIALRIIFILDIKIDKYQFDMGIGDIYSEKNYDELYTDYNIEPHVGRHINYIMRFYYNEGFPDNIFGQFYHPPLHHFIMSVWLKIMDNFFTLSSIKIESMQILSLIYFVITIISIKKILDELEIERKNQVAPMLILGSFPLFIYLAGFINNDSLVTMFSVLSLLYLIKWNKNQTIKNTVLLSVFLGLGLMTKSIIIIIVVPAVYIYFKKLIQNVNENKNVKILVIELLIFSIITLILGFWFHLYNFINNKNSFGIIMPFDSLSLKKYSYWQRFGINNILRINSYNIWNYLLNSSYNLGSIVTPILLQYILVIFTVIVFFISIYYCIKNINDILIITYLTWWIGYLYLNISLPYICSMHPRYMIVPFFINTIFIANGLQKEDNLKIKKLILLFLIFYSILNVLYTINVIF